MFAERDAAFAAQIGGDLGQGGNARVQRTHQRRGSQCSRRGHRERIAQTLDELEQVLRRDKFDRYCAKADRITRLEAYAQTVLVFDVQLEVTDCKDPTDNKFLALCTTADAKALVTGDKKDLLVMHPCQNTAVVGLRAFVDGFTAYL